MPSWAYLLIAIAILVVLVIIFFVSFIAYHRLPAPKGCEDLDASEEHCTGCNNISCTFYKRYNEGIKREEK